MTAPAPSPAEQAEIERSGIFEAAVDVDALDKLRSALANTLAGTSVRVDFAGLLTNMEARRIAEVLAPAVERIANERAAAELEAAARDFDPARRSWLIRRAAALRASNGAGVGT